MESITQTTSAITKRKYTLPEFKSIFEHQLSPFHNTVSRSEAIDWCYELSALPKQAFDKSIRSAALFVDYFYPFCGRIDKFLNIMKLVLYLIIWDDHTENDYGQCRINNEEGRRNWAEFFHVMDVLQNKGKSIDVNQLKSFSFAIYSVCASICEDLNDTQKKRLIDLVKEFGEGCLQEDELIKDLMKDKNIGLEQINIVRDKSGGVTACQFLIEYGCDLCLTEAEWTNPKFQRLILLANRAIIYVNDIYSFEKELKEKNECIEEMSLNLVAYKLIKDNSGVLDHRAVSHAMEWLTEKAREVETQINELCSEMSKDNNNSESVKQFAEYMKYFVSANYIASTKMARYNQL